MTNSTNVLLYQVTDTAGFKRVYPTLALATAKANKLIAKSNKALSLYTEVSAEAVGGVLYCAWVTNLYTTKIARQEVHIDGSIAHMDFVKGSKLPYRTLESPHGYLNTFLTVSALRYVSKLNNCLMGIVTYKGIKFVVSYSANYNVWIAVSVAYDSMGAIAYDDNWIIQVA